MGVTDEDAEGATGSGPICPIVRFGHSHSLCLIIWHHGTQAEQKEREAKAKGEDDCKGDSEYVKFSTTGKPRPEPSRSSHRRYIYLISFKN